MEQPSLRTIRKQVEWKSENYELKKSQPSRLVGGAERQKGGSHIHVWWIKFLEGYFGIKESQTHTRPPRPGFQCQEDKSIWILAAKTLAWIGRRKYWTPKKSLLKNPHTDLLFLRFTLSELQHRGSSLKGTNGMQGGTEVSAIKVRAGGEISPRQKGGQRPLFLSWTLSPKSHRAHRWVPYLRLHQPG